MIKPGSTIGILGGGQLGRMLCIAAAQFGLKTHVFSPETESCAFDVATYSTCASYSDAVSLEKFASQVEVVTYEFENVPLAAAERIAHQKPLRPGIKALANSQDRWIEKSFIASNGFKTAPFLKVDSLDDYKEALSDLGFPCILKSRHSGYDGKGQVFIKNREEAARAWDMMGDQPAILEGFVHFTREVSVIGARDLDGMFKTYDLCENIHQSHILAQTTVPAQLPEHVAEQARHIAHKLAEALDYTGVLTLELFVSGENDSLIVNEIAPRVHNSGHWTLEGARTSQFEQHIRAICGWPLGDVSLLGTVRMQNLIGPESNNWMDFLNDDTAHLHLYGKGEPRQGRKMGHVTFVT